jgi:hypothetical protein
MADKFWRDACRWQLTKLVNQLYAETLMYKFQLLLNKAAKIQYGSSFVWERKVHFREEWDRQTETLQEQPRPRARACLAANPMHYSCHLLARSNIFLNREEKRVQWKVWKKSEKNLSSRKLLFAHEWRLEARAAFSCESDTFRWMCKTGENYGNEREMNPRPLRTTLRQRPEA